MEPVCWAIYNGLTQEYKKNKKTYSKQTFDYTDYNNDMYYNNVKEVVIFDKIIKESCII